MKRIFFITALFIVIRSGGYCFPLNVLTCRLLARSPRCEIILFSSFSEHNRTVSKALCHFAQTTRSLVFLSTVTMSLQRGEYARSQHVDGTCWRFLEVFKRDLDCDKGVSLSLALNMQSV